jgi:hypothetical protein
MAPYHYTAVTVGHTSPTIQTPTANGPISLHYSHCRPLKTNQPNTNCQWPHFPTLQSLSDTQIQPNKHQQLMAPYHYTTFTVANSSPTNQTPTANGPISLQYSHCRPLKPNQPNTNFEWPHITTLESLSAAQAQPTKHQHLMAPYHHTTITIDNSSPTNQTPNSNGPKSLQ